MILLSFTVRNHKSIRDELTLDFTRPSLRTLQPKQGDSWRKHVYPLAGIFGANATGKSAVLDALLYTFSAIRHSATSWQAERHMMRAPFVLDEASAQATSMYELDFVSGGRRHLYGFEVDATGVSREWLRDVPSTRWRTLIERDRGDDTLKLHPSVRTMGDVTQRELVLSRALLLDHPQLAPVARDLETSFDLVSVKDVHRERRLDSIADALMEGSITFDDIVTLLQIADIGIEDVTVQEEDLPKKFREALLEFRRKLMSPDDATPDVESDHKGHSKDELGDEESDAVVRSLLFRHRGSPSDGPGFHIGDESDGTIAWLALMVPALEILRNGGLYCADEIDSSLHPHLLDVILGIFADVALNPKGAQLLFTSHDTYILSPLSDIELEPEQVWFTDKTVDGVTELTCLAEFPRHRDANVARRYLLGRYGGTPRLAPSSLAALLQVKDS